MIAITPRTARTYVPFINLPHGQQRGTPHLMGPGARVTAQHVTIDTVAKLVTVTGEKSCNIYPLNDLSIDLNATE